MISIFRYRYIDMLKEAANYNLRCRIENHVAFSLDDAQEARTQDAHTIDAVNFSEEWR